MSGAVAFEKDAGSECTMTQMSVAGCAFRAVAQVRHRATKTRQLQFESNSSVRTKRHLK
jgi:hypothetical protein